MVKEVILNHSSLFRYILIGLSNNLWGYLTYLIMTFLGLSPKIALVILYPIGIVSAYLTHKKYSFKFYENHLAVKVKFLMVYILGFYLNLKILDLFFVHMGYPHQVIQGLSIGVVASLNYILLKFFVFHSNICAIKK